MTPRVRKLGLSVMALCLVLVAGSAFSSRGLGRLAHLRSEVESVEVLNERLQEENDRLVLRIKALRDDPTTIEAVAREDLGLVKPGEVVFRFEGGTE